MSTHTIHIRLLTGEIIQLICPASQEFDVIQLLDELYPHVPEVPYGSLALRRVLPEFEELDLQDDDVLFRRMGETLLDEPCDPYEVTELYDGMELVAVSNLSLLSVSISPYGCIVFADPEEDVTSTMLTFQLQVHTRDPHFAAFHEDILFTVTFIANYHYTKFALYENTMKSTNRYRCLTAAPNFRWYNSLSECLLHATEPIPRDQTTLQRLERVFRFEQWYKAGLPWIQGPHGWHQDLPEVEDEQEDEHDYPERYDYADEYDAAAADQEFYEDYVR